MDSFCEQVVSRKNTTKHHIFAGALVTFFVLLEVLFILFYVVAPSPFWILINFMIGMAAAFIIAKAIPRIYKVEYDYSVVGNNFYIDKVIASKKRKSYAKVEISNITELELIENDNVPNVKYAKTYDCSNGDYEGNHYCIFHEANKGKCLMIFSPNQKIIDGMRPYMTRELVMKVFYNKK